MMNSELLDPGVSKEERRIPTVRSKVSTGFVLVKANSESEFQAIIPPALVVAQALNRCVRLVEILDVGNRDAVPIDPVEWDIRKRKAQARLSRLIEQYREAACEIDSRVIQNCLPKLAVDSDDPQCAPIFCCARHNTVLPWDLEDATTQVMHAGSSSVLLVPTDGAAPFKMDCKRILVTLDGSSRAERALPVAVAIANHHHAELLVVHASPDPGLIETGPLEAEAVELQTRVMDRNRRIAKEYLGDIRVRLTAQTDSLSTRLLEGGDVRHQLVDTINGSDVDLVLIASQGATGHSDVPTGSVAKFIMEHVEVPMLMVGPEKKQPDSGLYRNSESTDTRLPTSLDHS